MRKTLSIIALALLLTSCAGIRYCKENETKGCQPWDPATKTGMGSRS